MSFKYTASKRNRRASIVSVNEHTANLVIPSKDFIFNQATIVSSVCLERNGFKITPQTSKYVNSNGDAWSNDSLRVNYPSFIGAYNYVNHVQEPDKSVGFIADAALRKLMLDREQNLFIYIVDILVATSRDYSDLVNKILTNQIQYLSMGCDVFVSQCSKCGGVYEDEDDMCDHLLLSKGKSFIDENGEKRKIAELLGTGDEGTVEFTEASYLTQVPASGMAVTRSNLPIPDGQDVVLTVPTGAVKKDAVTRFCNIEI